MVPTRAWVQRSWGAVFNGYKGTLVQDKFQALLSNIVLLVHKA